MDGQMDIFQLISRTGEDNSSQKYIMKMLGLETYIAWICVCSTVFLGHKHVTGSDMKKKMEEENLLVTLLVTEIISSIFLLFICVVIFYVSVRWTRLFLRWNTDLQ